MQALTTLSSENHRIKEGKHSSRFSIGRFFRNLHFGRPRGFQLVAELPHHDEYPADYDHWNKLGGYGWGLPRWRGRGKSAHQYAVRLGYKKARGKNEYLVAPYIRWRGELIVLDNLFFIREAGERVMLTVKFVDYDVWGFLDPDKRNISAWSFDGCHKYIGEVSATTPLRTHIRGETLHFEVRLYRTLWPQKPTLTYGLNPYFGGQPTAPTDTEYHILRGVI